MDWLTTLGYAMGSAWMTGLSLYATVVTLGLLQKFGLAHLPGELGFLSHWWVIALAGSLYTVEFIADKIPAVDSAWQAVHTFIRVPAGAVLAAAAFAHFDPGVRIAAFLIGGGVALSSHGTKAVTRVAANTSPEPFSNIALSVAEDAATIGSGILMAFHPLVLLGFVTVFVIGAVFFARWLAPRVARLLRSVWGGFFGNGERREPSSA